ncbi:DEAD/DEAH box helicase [Arcobacter sp. F155]|uniref:DEAD/DEAH box helicase n=1 Tax=Arcobacter sp. F155 TaxID=2044512 RepID=UPI00100C1A39|nr:DEAD/DEAH box helicase [Arcobacter sp. F155]RXJ77027.1 DEAD/DEAH box helicase [Arcobacter sp. F155]
MPIVNDIEQLIEESLSSGFRGRLLDRGLARSMIWKNGILPDGAPHFADSLSYDLLSYGYSLLSLGIRLKELGGDEVLYNEAFKNSANAIMDVVHNGEFNSHRSFHKILASSAFHIGQYSAKAYSLVSNLDYDSLTPIENILRLLILRKFKGIEKEILLWKYSGQANDINLAESLNSKIDEIVNSSLDLSEKEKLIKSLELSTIDLALTDNYFSAMYEYLFALEVSREDLYNNSIEIINNALNICNELKLVPQWWVFRVTKFLLIDLWNRSFHKLLPLTPSDPNSKEWEILRWKYIASLYKRNKSEVELWPSQISAARRAVSDTDDLVVSLPTSAGKTRVAELCILRCLSIKKRVLFITPLRALSAQTETSLRKTFLPLGKTVSSLYGSIGISNFEEDVLKTQDIVVGTPEKLDFALRNDSTILDDIGLIVLDEGHMIGLSEREINYEVQIQRLLNRTDSNTRRIVCLSAILPSGEEFDNFVNWLRKDKPGDAVKTDWRPTDLRFAEVIWQENTARLNFLIGEENPFIPSFLRPMIPSNPNPGRRQIPFPKNQQELTLATAWKLIEDEHTVLIYCPQKKSVNSFAEIIVDLHIRGALPSLFESIPERLELAKTLGKEWLGEHNFIVKCLDIGVGVHHGSLPTPFRKEMENLLRDGVLKVTVSSPTLAQGLNLSATAVVFHSLHRNGDIIDVSEFKNVIGRAGRAFIDTQGLIIRPIFDSYTKKIRQWHTLINDVNARSMKSGLMLLIEKIITLLISNYNPKDERELEQLLNDKLVMIENTSQDEIIEEWNNLIKFLDSALISMLGEVDIVIDKIGETLLNVLDASLWKRTIESYSEVKQKIYSLVLKKRAEYIWQNSSYLQRKGYFLAGLGLDSGQKLDMISLEANRLLVFANRYIEIGDIFQAIVTIQKLAELIFNISPFIPSTLPSNWKDILESWLKGETLTEKGFVNIEEVLEFVEDGLVYRLIWGLEAIKVRAKANEDIIDGYIIDDFETNLLVPSIENGTLNRSVALLMQAGFNSRKAAIQAVTSTNASFTNSLQLNSWLSSIEVRILTESNTWPTKETSSLWKKFLFEFKPESNMVWNSDKITLSVKWNNEYTPLEGTLVKLSNYLDGNTQVLSTTGNRIGILNNRLNLIEKGIYYSIVTEDINIIDVLYWGIEQPFNIVS